MMRRILIAGLTAWLGCGQAIAASAEPNPTVGRPESQVYAISEAERSILQAYSEQREALQKTLGDNVFVADCKGIVHDNHLATFAIWTDSVPTALPKTDFVWLQDAKMKRWFVVSWSDLESAIGKLTALKQVDPQRYLTPANIPVSYFKTLERAFVPPKGFPERVASGRR